MAEYKRNLTRERTTAGLVTARTGVRPKALDERQVKVAIALADAGKLMIRKSVSK